MTGVVLWILLLVFRLVDLQVLRYDEFVLRARKQQEGTTELPPRRGQILDRDGRALAVTAQIDSIFAVPGEIDDPEEVAASLAPLLGLSKGELAKKVSDVEKSFVWIARRVPEETARLVASRKLPGVRLFKESIRRYPQGPLAAPVLGYAGTDNQGLAGLEYRYDADVRGRPARVTLLRDAARRSYASASGLAVRNRIALAEGVEGASLVLTLDSTVQHAAERELENVVKQYNARGASAIVVDPWTGQLLALASYPSFDPNRYGESGFDARRCRPLSDIYEPGSTFKAVTVSGGLELGTISENDMVDCGNGSMTIGNVTIHEHGRKSYSVLPVKDVLAQSSNIGSARIGLGLGRGNFYKTVRAFGFGQKTGVELEGETAGLLPSPASWNATTLPTMAFGQAIGVTVLQMARAYCAIAADGLLPKLTLVSEVRLPNGTTRTAPAVHPVRVLSKETAGQMRRLLGGVVEFGTGKRASSGGYTVAGKTGTAQKANPGGGGYSRDRHVASFIGFTPAEAPRIVVAVVVDEPKGTIYGGDVAAPVFAAIGAETLRILAEPAAQPLDTTRPTVMTADLASGSRLQATPVLSGDLVPASLRSRRTPESVLSADGTIRIPSLAGVSAREAVRLLAASGLSAKLSGIGFVVTQDPPAGSPVEPGATCSLTLALEPRAPQVSLLMPPHAGGEP